MSRRAPLGALTLTLVALLAAPFAHAIAPTRMPTPALEARYERLIHNFRCMQCQDESLANSPVSLAADMRRQIRQMLLAGDTDQQIAFDPGGLEAIHWGVYGAPETFIVNPQGIIVYKYIGPITPGAWTRDFLPRLQAAQTVSGS